MGKLIDLTGQRFGRLRVIERAEDHISSSGRRRIMWLCRCDCGSTISVFGENLKRGVTKSCGCLSAEKSAAIHCIHGMTGTRLYRIWKGMKERCTYKKHIRFKKYGGRGITVCDEWLHDFKAFYDWAMANGYKDDLSIDRIDNSLGYSPDNCRWASATTQVRNRSITRKLNIADETRPLAEWCEIYNLPLKTVKMRLSTGWTPEEALGIIPRNK